MIKIEKNTLQQEVWFPRTERGNNTFRKTYQDGFDDGYQDGLSSSKIKLYDGMQLAYSDIYDLNRYDFSDVKSGGNMFYNCSFYNDYYDLSFVGDWNDTGSIFSRIRLKNRDTTMIVKLREISSFGAFYVVDADYPNSGTLHCTLTEKVKDAYMMFSYNYGFGTINLYGDFSECTGFREIVNWINSDGKTINFNHFDMGNETNKTEDIFGNTSKNWTIRISGDSPRSTFTRLLDDGTRYNHLDWTYCYGKERWTYDAVKKEWVLSGYDD